MTLNQFLPLWNSRAEEMKPSTQRSSASYLKVLRARLGDTDLAALTPPMLQGSIGVWKRQYAPKTIKNLIGLLRAIWNTAEQWGYVEGRSPFRGLKIADHEPRQARTFSAEQVRRILEAALEPDRTLYALAAETGLRAGELCGLRREDLQQTPDGWILLVRRSVWGRQVINPKTARAVRKLAISGPLASRLLGRADVYLFGSRPLNASSALKRLHRLLDKLGIPQAGFHAFRHYNATEMDRLGVPLRVRQERLGHSDPSLTLGTYTHAVSQDEVQFVQAMAIL